MSRLKSVNYSVDVLISSPKMLLGCIQFLQNKVSYNALSFLFIILACLILLLKIDYTKKIHSKACFRFSNLLKE